MNHKSYDTRTPFIDLLLNLAATLFLMLFVQSLLVNIITKKQDGIQMNAQYMITAEWPKEVNCDVDLWVRDPALGVSWYRQKDVNLMHLERDDLGAVNDTVWIDGKMLVNPENKEYWVLRGLIPGEFTVNLHLYSCSRNDASNTHLPTGFKADVPVKVQLQRVNPTLVMNKDVTVVLERVWDEKTVFRFTLDADGTITSSNEVPAKLIKVTAPSF